MAEILGSGRSRVIVPLDFFIAKSAKEVWVAFPAWIKSRPHSGCSAVNHAVKIMCADRAE